MLSKTDPIQSTPSEFAERVGVRRTVALGILGGAQSAPIRDIEQKEISKTQVSAGGAADLRRVDPALMHPADRLVLNDLDPDALQYVLTHLPPAPRAQTAAVPLRRSRSRGTRRSVGVGRALRWSVFGSSLHRSASRYPPGL